MSALERLGIQSAASAGASSAQEQTKQTFAFKWAKRETYESPAMQEAARRWLFERYCENDPTRLDSWLAGGAKLILDAGCGAGHSALLFFGEHLNRHDYLGVDISEAVNVARLRFEEAGRAGDFLQADITKLPVPDASVDMIFSEGVLHHTDDTGEAIRRLVRKLRRGGRFLFYVYAKKAVIREFTDDHIRAALAGLSDEQAWEALKPLTALGEALGRMQAQITVPADIPHLGIRQGTYDLQRFFYWHICKMYYRPEFAFDEMNHINFDWFRPHNCHRHTPEEIRGICAEAGLEIEQINIQEAGITVVAVRR